jgi:molybdate transport system substrate-binding protein
LNTRPCERENHLEDALRPSIRLATLSLAAALGVWGAGPARSAEITVYLNQATATGVREMAAGFEQATGNKVKVNFEVGQALYQKLVAGIKQGKVVPGTVVEYGRVGNGVAVKAGAPKPDISTPESFKRAMLDAKSIGHTRVGTGPFNTTMFKKLGIYEEIKDKIKIIEGKLVAEAVRDGDVEIGIQQTNVIQPLAGTQYLGPLPAELMEYGPVGVGLLTVSKQPEVAKAFIKFMADPANAGLLRKGYMEPPLH